MEKKILILEDNPAHYKLIEEGVKASKYNTHIYELDLRKLIINIKNKISVESIPNDIDIFIIDVSLRMNEDHNELGLQFLVELRLKYNNKFDYIITSNWDRSEFQLMTDLEESNFINKNNHQGFEFRLKIKHMLNSL